MSGVFTIAVHALVYLNHRQETLSSEELSENICTNPARVRKVMAMLHRAGLVEVRPGKYGGYRFVLDPSGVTLLRICKAVETPPVPAGWRSGEIDAPCLVASGMAEVMEQVRDSLNAACYKRLSSMTVAGIDHILFGASREETR